jgi:uncharacterized protein (DUF427 family)
VRVLIDGEVVADTHRPWLLFETGLPVRYYLPRSTCAWTVSSRPTSHTAARTRAGVVLVSAVGGQRHDDVVWSYPHRCRRAALAGLVAFYNDRVTIEVDGRRRLR